MIRDNQEARPNWQMPQWISDLHVNTFYRYKGHDWPKLELFLQENSQLELAFRDGLQQIKNFFPEVSWTWLNLSEDSDFGTEPDGLIVTIPTTLDPTQAREQMDKLDEVWGLKLPPDVQDKFLTTLEFV